MKKATGKHLTLDQRITILTEIKKGTSLKQIAIQVTKDPTTVSKEIKNNRICKESNNKRISICHECVHLMECKEKHLCGDNVCSLLCKQCHSFNPNKDCNKFEESVCKQIIRFPYVCTGCNKAQNCRKNHYYYDPKIAQENYETTLRESREGLNLNEHDFNNLNEIVSKGIKDGKSIYSILLNHPELDTSERTIYRYVAKRYLDAKDHDLRSKTKLKPRKAYGSDKKFNKEIKAIREGRTYEDYLKFLADNRQAYIPQFDLVIGKKEDNQYLMTIHFPFSNFMLAYLIPDKTPESVVNVFNNLEDKLGLEDFKTIFPGTLTDRGKEFIKANEIEKDSDGNERTKVFYCDAYTSSQKAEIERNHEFFRFYFPQGESLNSLTQDEVNLIFSNINSYNRKVKGGRTPYEIFEFINGKEILDKLSIKKIPFDEIVLNKSLIRNFK